MKYSQSSGVEDDEDNKKDINFIIEKYKSYSENKIKSNDNIENKASYITSQYWKRTKNSSSITDKSNQNSNIKIFEEDLNKSVSSDIGKKSIKTNNSLKISKKDIEINIENDINRTIINKNNIININLNKNNFNNSEYDTSNNIFTNYPNDNSKIFFNNNKNKILLKNKVTLNIIKNITHKEENQFKKEIGSQIFKNNKLKINNKNNYTNKIYRNKFKKSFNKKSRNTISSKTDNIKKETFKYKINNYNIKNECKCKYHCNNLINIIRGILLFLIISSTLIFYIYIFILY